MGKQKKHKPSHKQRTGLMDRSDIPYAQRLKLQQKADINISREQAAKVTLYCLSVAMYEIKKVGYTRW